MIATTYYYQILVSVTVATVTLALILFTAGAGTTDSSTSVFLRDNSSVRQLQDIDSLVDPKTVTSRPNFPTRPVEVEFPYPLTCDKNELHQFLQNNNLIDNDQTGEKKISITLVYHIGMVGNWETVVADQFHVLNECGTLEIADQLFLTYSNDDEERLLDFIYPLIGDNNRLKIKAVKASTKSPWEGPAMNMMLDHCNESPSPKKEVVFYFHNKGTSRWTEDWQSKIDEPFSYVYALYWRKYLEYFTIERPQLCLDRLLIGDATSCGPNWREGNGDKFKGGIHDDPNYSGRHHPISNHYSGNFWSATCEHINHLEPLMSKQYTAGELWIGTWEGKQAKLTTHFKKLYSNLVVPEEYALVGAKQQELEPQ